jgi:hypothetical protein
MKKSIAVKALSAGLCVAMSVSVASCAGAKPTEETTEETTTDEETVTETSEETTTEETTTETTPESTLPLVNPYEEFIAGYQEAIKDHTETWYYGPGVDTSDYMNLGQGLIVSERGDRFSYLLYDFDKDGEYELVLGSIVIDGNGNEHIWIDGIVALDGDGYKIVAAGWTRSSLEYVGGGYVVHGGSGGASLHYDGVYLYDGVNKELATVGLLVTEYEHEDGQVVAKYSYFDSDDDAYRAFPAYGNENAVCFDDDAKAKMDADMTKAYMQTNDMMDLTWTKVECV